MRKGANNPKTLPASSRRKSIDSWKNAITDVLNDNVIIDSWKNPESVASCAELRVKKSSRRKYTDELEELGDSSHKDRAGGGIDKQARIVTFTTIGKAPVEAPGRPARLTPIRRMTPSPPLFDAVVPEVANVKDEDPHNNLLHTPRSFSRQCHHVMKEQGKALPFDVYSIYLGCEFFNYCSCSFLRELIRTGGPQAWRGLCIPPHAKVYQEGDIGHSMYVIGRGMAASVGPNGQVKQEYGISDYFGHPQVLGVTTRRLETIVAKTTLQLFVTTQNTLTKLLKGSHHEEHDANAPNHMSALHKADCPSPYKADSPSQSPRRGHINSSTFADERRHFEAESVRVYKEFLGVRPKSKRRTVLRKITLSISGKLAGEPHAPIERPEDVIRRLAAEKEARHAIVAAGVTGCDCIEVTQARDRLFGKVASSLRTDLRRGYMMPADHCDQADKYAASEAHHDTQNQLRRQIRSARSERELARSEVERTLLTPVITEDDEEIMKNDPDDPLDPHLIPPIALLSPVQKHGILRQLKHQSRGKVGNVAKRGHGEKGTDYLATGVKALSSMANASCGVASMASLATSIGSGEASAVDSEMTDILQVKA